ncbi:oleosin 16.4 kDa-like [Neltuma alba]|uniref:oleosin 16.4 kDa-like n=1 Tax=Neltuma alba TaxID=207710 RepID=UPI0010A49DCF|nr:oleosin 16.4 kDa-like [Prosopis alba]
MAEIRQDYYYRYQHNPTQTSTVFPEKAPSSSQVLALSFLLPLGAFLLFVAAITGTGTVVGIALSTPLFVIFSPVLLPAAFLIGLAVAGFLTSGAFGVTAFSSFTWLANFLRRSRLSEQLEYAKHRAEETIGHAAQSVKEAGETVLSKAQEAGQEAQTKSKESRQRTQSGKAQEEKRFS